jgi:hypothetical protein
MKDSHVRIEHPVALINGKPIDLAGATGRRASRSANPIRRPGESIERTARYCSPSADPGTVSVPAPVGCPAPVGV